MDANELLGELYRLAMHKGILTTGHRQRLERNLFRQPIGELVTKPIDGVHYVMGPRIATAGDANARWNMGAPGEMFRCYLCGKRLAEGDLFAVIIPLGGDPNFVVGGECHTTDVLLRWHTIAEEYRDLKERFWWAEHSSGG